MFVGWITGQGKCLQYFDSSSVLAMRKSSHGFAILDQKLGENLKVLGPRCSVGEHEDLFKDILKKTPRLNKEEATRAVKKAFPSAEANIQAAFAASMIPCVQSVFAKHKSMTSGRKLGAPWLRLISIVDDLYPLPSGSKVSASSSKPSLPLVIDAVAKDVETLVHSGEEHADVEKGGRRGQRQFRTVCGCCF